MKNVLLAIHEHKCTFPYTFTLWQSQHLYPHTIKFSGEPCKGQLSLTAKQFQRPTLQALPITILKCKLQYCIKLYGTFSSHALCFTKNQKTLKVRTKCDNMTSSLHIFFSVLDEGALSMVPRITGFT